MQNEDFKVLRQLGQEGAQGVVYLVEFPNHLRAAMKQFKKNKSVAKIQSEADFQRRAANVNIAPAVMHVDTKNRRIFMEPMQSRIVDVLQVGTDRFSADLRVLMDTLDDIGILHNDGNALNLMLNEKDELRIIDFGLAKNIDSKLKKKWKDRPNIEVTMHMLKKGLRKYKIYV